MDRKKKRHLEIQCAATKKYYQKKKHSKQQGMAVIDCCQLIRLLAAFSHSNMNCHVLGIIKHWIKKIK
jgi:hypothetical protein